LTIRSESERPHEWGPIAWVIRNRVEKPERFGQTLGDVVFAPWQFSYWNKHRDRHHMDRDVALKAALEDYPGRDEEVVNAAMDCLQHVLWEAPRWKAPFDRDVYHFYSPISMPAGVVPSWIESPKAQQIHLSGIDPNRFTFVRGV